MSKLKKGLDARTITLGSLIGIGTAIAALALETGLTARWTHHLIRKEPCLED